MKDAVLELTSESVFVRVFPLSAHDLEGDVFVRRAGGEPKSAKVRRVSSRRHRVLGSGSMREWMKDENTIHGNFRYLGCINARIIFNLNTVYLQS